jgi:hypothetical protein
MGTRLKERSALLAKIESVYGTDPVPTGAANAMYVYELSINPIELVAQQRNPVRPFFGSDVAIVGGTPVKCSFSVPMAGGGAAGTAPGFGALLRGCARSETVNPGVDVTYALISGTFESVTLYANRDGVLHKITGARGNVSVEFAHEQVPMLKFNFTGIYNAPTDTALPTLTFGAVWPKPLVQNAVNTTPFTFFGVSPILSKLSYDAGCVVDWKDWVNLTEQVRITNRAAPMKGSVTVQADTIAFKDWYATAKAGTTGALSLTHGTAAGNKYKIDAATVRITDVAEEDENGIVMAKMGLEFYPTSAGNDEIVEKAL